MAELDHVAQGWSTPAVALTLSILGYLAGILLAAIGRTRAGRWRVRLLLFGAIGGGGVAIWLTNVINLLRHPARAGGAPGQEPIDPLPIAVSLGGALLLLGAGLLLTSFGRPVLWRLLLAGSCVGVSLATTHYVLVASTHAAGSPDNEPTRLILPGVVAVAAAAATLWFATGSHRFLVTILAALIMGWATTSAHVAGMWGVRVYLGSALDGGLTGIEPLLLLGPLVLVGTAVAAALAFFSLAPWAARERHALARSADDTIWIEARMIEEVTSRVSVTFVPAPAADSTQRLPLPARRPMGPRPTPGNAPIWQSMPVWGTEPVEAASAEASPAGTAIERRSPPLAPPLRPPLAPPLRRS